MDRRCHGGPEPEVMTVDLYRLAIVVLLVLILLAQLGVLHG